MLELIIITAESITILFLIYTCYKNRAVGNNLAVSTRSNAEKDARIMTLEKSLSEAQLKYESLHADERSFRLLRRGRGRLALAIRARRPVRLRPRPHRL